MKIAFIYDAVYPFLKGGGEKRYWEIGTRLAAQGHDVTLVCIQAWEGPPDRKEGGISYVGVCPPMSLFTPSGKRALKPPFAFASGVYRHLRDTPYDLVDCCSFPLVSCLAARRALPKRVPLVITWFEVRDLAGWVRYTGVAGLLAYGLQQWTARLTRHHIAISKFTQHHALLRLGIPAERCAVIPCGVNVAEYAPPATAGVRNRLLCVGRLVRHKQVDWLIRAFQAIAGEFPDLVLTIVGTGPEEAGLRQQAGQTGLGGRIEFKGLVSQAELVDTYRSARAFVLPSEQEGFGMVLVEAMAAGAPVLALKAERSAATEIVEHEQTGLVFSSEVDLVKTLRRLLGDLALQRRLAAAGLARASEYDWDRSVAPAAGAYYAALAAREREAAHGPV